MHNLDPRKPYSPHAVSSRYKDMAERLGIKTHIHALRHYATKLLTAGVDLRRRRPPLPRRGRSDHPSCLRSMAASDRKAAEILGSQMSKLSRDRTS